MELFQLEQFLAAARLENITRAAEELSLTQPALSKNIKALENELGYPLFSHVGRSIALNENGRILEKHAKRAFAALQDARAELYEFNQKQASSISICVHAASHLIPQMLVDYKQAHPAITFSLSQELSGEAAGRPFDFIIDASLSPAAGGGGSLTLVREELLVALPRNHRLAKRKRLALSELKDEPFVGLRKGYPLSQITEFYCNMSGFAPHVVFDSDNPATLRNIISLGTGVALIPSLTWDMRQYSNLALLPISAPDCCRYITLSLPRERILGPEKQAFLSYLTKRFQELGKPAAL